MPAWSLNQIITSIFIMAGFVAAASLAYLAMKKVVSMKMIPSPNLSRRGRGTVIFPLPWRERNKVRGHAIFRAIPHARLQRVPGRMKIY